MKAKVAERGQVTIPKQLRESLGIRPGSTLHFYSDHGRLVATKVVEDNPIDLVFGSLGSGRNTDDVMRTLRDEER
ncbi:AbrB/MazE/SpoVT family DNA-binding domain-containing protein [Magnetococcales bacterium HHB-1]